jgi:hypothetical protein
LIPLPLAAAPAVKGLAVERATGIGPGAAAGHVEGVRHGASGSRWSSASGAAARRVEGGGRIAVNIARLVALLPHGE